MQMVGKNREFTWRLRVLDLAGGATCVLLVGAAAWLAFVHLGQAQQEAQVLRADVETARQTLSTVEAAGKRQETLVLARQGALAERGRLPDAAPVEEYRSAMVAAADAHQLTVLGYSLGASRRYGDVSEQCLLFQVSGAAANLMRFLRAVEESPFWADIGYLRVEGDDAIGPANSAPRRASLTFSLFASTAPASGNQPALALEVGP